MIIKIDIKTNRLQCDVYSMALYDQRNVRTKMNLNTTAVVTDREKDLYSL